MFSKYFFYLLIVFRAGLIRSENFNEGSPDQKKIQCDGFKNLTVLTRILWNTTADDDQNEHFFPVLVNIHIYITLMQLSYQYKTLFEIPYAMSPYIDKLQRQSPNVELEFKIAIFYDDKYASKELLHDLRTYYRAETFAVAFDADNERSIANLIESWTTNNAKGWRWKNETLQRLDSAGILKRALLSFTGFWDVPNTISNSIESIPRGRFTTRTLRFNATQKLIDVKAFGGREKVGYYNDAEKNYEAIGIPFGSNEFSMILQLPHYNSSLESLKTFSDRDYRRLFRRVKYTKENIHFEIPVINSTTFSVNEKGVSVNGGDLTDQVSVSRTYETDKIQFKPFLVNRPFGVIIFHEKTFFVLLHALVKNPSSSLSTSSTIQIKISFGEEVNFQQID